ncbi:MAG: cellulase family glycosylhydrolase [Flavobacterium sp.]|nr:cellulase family glycosylhydrolase [Pedobacter sp.]
MKKIKKAFAVALLSIAVLSCKKTELKENETLVTKNLLMKAQTETYNPIAATAAMVAMGTGFNLGNTFDLAQHSTVPSTIYPIIDLYYNAGFRNIRIPTTWMDGFSGNHLASATGTVNFNHPRFIQLKAVIDYALSKPNMYVILNTHHEHWLKRYYNGTATYNTPFTNLWTGISNHFKNYPNRLVFEVLNEPEGALGDWDNDNGTTVSPNSTTAITLTKQLNQVGYDAIRATGGPNTTRIVMVSPNAQANTSQFEEVYNVKESLPGGGNDDYLAIHLHTYNPWNFCGQKGSNSNYGGRTGIINGVSAIVTHAAKLAVAVHVGEFGVGRVDSSALERNSWQVREYYRTLRRELIAKNIAATVWDDRGWFALISGNSTTGYQFVNNIVPTMMAASIVNKAFTLTGSNSFLVTGSNGQAVMKSNIPLNTGGSNERFYIVDAGTQGGKISLRSMNLFASSENGLIDMNCNRSTATVSEEFWWEMNNDGKISLKGNNLSYVSIDNVNNALRCNKTSIGNTEKFTFNLVP